MNELFASGQKYNQRNVNNGKTMVEFWIVSLDSYSEIAP